MFSKYKLFFISIVLLLAFVIIFFFANRGVSEEKFIQVYIQFSLAQLKFEHEPEKFEEEKQKIFSEYKFSQKELERLVQHYKKNPEKWVLLWEKINQRLSELIERNKRPQSR